MSVARNPKVMFAAAVILLSLLSIAINGVQFGVEFRGGTLFHIQLEEPVSREKMETIVSVISQRLDAFGLKDTKVNSLGNDLLVAQIAETNPEQIARLESLLRTQGKFEATLDGNILFEGSDIVQVFKDATRGYGVGQSENGYTWNLPFLLNQTAGDRFSKSVFHRCTAVSFDPSSGTQYDCDSTYFFIDRPAEAVLIIPKNVFSDDSQLLVQGNQAENIPAGTAFAELMKNATMPYIVAESDNNFSQAESSKLASLLGTAKEAIVHPDASQGQRASLESMGYRVVEVKNERPETPWVWVATGARQIIALTPGIANLDPYVENPNSAKIFSELSITGSGTSQDEAIQNLKSLAILLETGSLPIGIKEISKESISPLLGEEFLSGTFLIGIIGLLVVALVLYIRYRAIKLALPILLTGLSEIVIVVGIASILRYNLDLASVAGILASVGTGVNDQIVIIDELKKGELTEGGSYANRVKKAFFIVFAAAATSIATMLPVILFGFGFGKLVGFAITTILGVLVGVLITRPAFSVLAEQILKGSEKS